MRVVSWYDPSNNSIDPGYADGRVQDQTGAEEQGWVHTTPILPRGLYASTQTPELLRTREIERTWTFTL